MRLAEKVTFGSSVIDRRADLRGDAHTLRAMAEEPGANHLAFWKGKVLLSGEGCLFRLQADAELLQFATEGAVFLGCTADGAFYAHDVSKWLPEDGAPATIGAINDPSKQRVRELPGDPEFCDLRSVMADLSLLDAELAASAKSVLGWHRSHRYCSYCGAKSRPAEGGWRRDCDDCKRQHFPRTDPVAIMLITKGNSVLLGRSYGWPEGMYSLLAGFVEPGETIENAVRREVLEETGVEVGRVEYLANQPWPFPSSLMFGCRGEALGDEIRVDDNELEDAMWVSREDMMDVFAGQHPTINAPRRGPIAGFILEHWLKDRLD